VFDLVRELTSVADFRAFELARAEYLLDVRGTWIRRLLLRTLEVRQSRGFHSLVDVGDEGTVLDACSPETCGLFLFLEESQPVWRFFSGTECVLSIGA
jgi:hypothetical protein